MASCLIRFDGKHYKCRGEGDENDKGLAIGLYKSAFLADLVASYILEKTQKLFNHIKFHASIVMMALWSWMGSKHGLKTSNKPSTNHQQTCCGNYLQLRNGSLETIQRWWYKNWKMYKNYDWHIAFLLSLLQTRTGYPVHWPEQFTQMVLPILDSQLSPEIHRPINLKRLGGTSKHDSWSDLS